MKKLIKFAMVLGAIAVAARLVSGKMDELKGLTESEVREKIDARMPERMPEDKRAEVADKIVSKLRERGSLKADAAPATE